MSVSDALAAETEDCRATLARMASAPIEHHCERCGGSAVTRDAWAEWDVAAQAWALSEMFDFAFCHHCHRETRLVARPAARAAEDSP